MHRVHFYDSSDAAYEACLDDSPCIKEGDVLAILAEGIIGLASSYPLAVTLTTGALHGLRPMTADTVLRETAHDADQWRHAVELAWRIICPSLHIYSRSRYAASRSRPPRRLSRSRSTTS